MSASSSLSCWTQASGIHVSWVPQVHEHSGAWIAEKILGTNLIREIHPRRTPVTHCYAERAALLLVSKYSLTGPYIPRLMPLCVYAYMHFQTAFAQKQLQRVSWDAMVQSSRGCF